MAEEEKVNEITDDVIIKATELLDNADVPTNCNRILAITDDNGTHFIEEEG